MKEYVVCMHNVCMCMHNVDEAAQELSRSFALMFVCLFVLIYFIVMGASLPFDTRLLVDCRERRACEYYTNYTVDNFYFFGGESTYLIFKLK